MNVELIRATPDPEELVCTAARNDYRSEGVAGYSFEEVMEAADADLDHVESVAEELDYPEPEQAAETAEESGLGEKSLEIRREVKKRTLLDHLIDSGHWGPFEHPQATLAIEGVTRVLMAQITRHRHFTFDVMSLRYVEVDDIDPDEPPHERSDLRRRFQFPEFRGEGFDVDREGVHEIANVESANTQYAAAYVAAIRHYKRLIGLGVPQEQARKVLPMGTKVNIVVSANARAWMHILNVRTKANVQSETRRCAERIFEELKDWMPYAFEKYDQDILPLKLNP